MTIIAVFIGQTKEGLLGGDPVRIQGPGVVVGASEMDSTKPGLIAWVGEKRIKSSH